MLSLLLMLCCSILSVFVSIQLNVIDISWIFFLFFSNVDRNQQREQQRQARALQAQQWQDPEPEMPLPLFAGPIKVGLKAHIQGLTLITRILLYGALLCYFERISAPVIYALSSPSAKCVKLKGAR